MARRSTSSDVALLLGGALLAIVSIAAPVGARGDDAAAKAAALAARNESLRRELALAEGDSFYLVLDDQTSRLTLMYKGAPLRETPLEAAQIGEPRARHGISDEPIDLYAPWTGGALHPPRINVREEVVPPPMAGSTPVAPPVGAQRAEQGEFVEGEAPPDATPVPVVEEVEIPKTPEELYPVPLSYEIRFVEGLTIEVVRSMSAGAAGAEAASTGAAPAGNGAAAAPVAGDHPEAYPTPPSPTLWERIAAVAKRATLARPEGERLRLRIVIDSLDADRLFRSLPADVKLLIRRPAAAAPPSPARS